MSSLSKGAAISVHSRGKFRQSFRQRPGGHFWVPSLHLSFTQRLHTSPGARGSLTAEYESLKPSTHLFVGRCEHRSAGLRSVGSSTPRPDGQAAVAAARG